MRIKNNHKAKPEDGAAQISVHTLVMPFNQLTPAEAERLALLSEELGEAQQIIGKILRHGYENCNPYDVNRIKNRNLLEKELGDVHAAIRLMLRSNDISSSEIRYFKEFKLKKIEKYLHHNEAYITICITGTKRITTELDLKT